MSRSTGGAQTRRELMEANGRACAIAAYGPPGDPSKTMSLDRLRGKPPVRVDVIESVRRGGKACRFAVHVQRTLAASSNREPMSLLLPKEWTRISCDTGIVP